MFLLLGDCNQYLYSWLVKFLPVYGYVNLLPRAFVRKTAWTNYMEEQLEAALDSVKSGRSLENSVEHSA
jgi:predicted extracellular nuclease